ncbi:NUDIX hydrolase [Aestuariimicrobium ganziense]|uniref:NUDIX hydrolase n=1 Tax=Aestuariimicrobium ganziense TaxID=2773677 RepID=UPI001940740B|nr:NUDIX domain-containing protein [Aestuariimicrobium ganziense]
MVIIGVASPGSAELTRVEVAHGEHPRVLLWRQGWLMNGLLSCRMDDGQVVLTARVTRRTSRSRPPKVKHRAADPDLVVAPGEEPVEHQRIAAYAVIRSPMGVLGTECSERTAGPGLGQLPGGGLQPGETPSEALLREVMEESGQTVRINHLLDLQSDHWVGRAPNGLLEDFHALRIFYSATCLEPSDPDVVDIDGTTAQAAWIPMWRWRMLPWTSGSRSILDKYASTVPTR